MKKIGVATVYTGYNYGSLLQAYATTRILQKIGAVPELFKLRGSLIAGRDIRLKKLITIITRSLCHSGGVRSLKNYKESISKRLSDETVALFNSFTIEELQPKEISYSDLKSLAKTDEYTAFLCGSDQVWNSSVFYVDPFYYLQFAPQEKRIAFAPSFGREYVPNYNKRIIGKYLSGIPYKSVRESSGVNIIKELTGEYAKVLIDPTLVLTSDEWTKYLKIEAFPKKNYLLAYFLDTPSALAIKTINQISNQYNLEVVGLPYSFDDLPWKAKDAGPKEFVEYINGASFICTDSFHGTAFALNFNVPFYTFERNYGNADKQSTRIYSLLDMAKSIDRLEPMEIKDPMNLPFEHINSVLFQQRNISYDYLSEILNR